MEKTWEYFSIYSLDSHASVKAMIRHTRKDSGQVTTLDSSQYWSNDTVPANVCTSFRPDSFLAISNSIFVQCSAPSYLARFSKYGVPSRII